MRISLISFGRNNQRGVGCRGPRILRQFIFEGRVHVFQSWAGQLGELAQYILTTARVELRIVDELVEISAQVVRTFEHHKAAGDEWEERLASLQQLPPVGTDHGAVPVQF